MKDWELRYIHARDVRDAQLESLGLPPIVGERFGELTFAPELVWRRFDGPKFWPIFRGKGHTSTAFDECQCRKGTET